MTIYSISWTLFIGTVTNGRGDSGTLKDCGWRIGLAPQFFVFVCHCFMNCSVTVLLLSNLVTFFCVCFLLLRGRLRSCRRDTRLAEQLNAELAAQLEAELAAEEIALFG